jgi:hypothetical protein
MQTTTFSIHSTSSLASTNGRLAAALAPFEAQHATVRRGPAQPAPFALVTRRGIGRGTTYRLVGTYRHLDAVARAAATAEDLGFTAWICLAPGFTVTPRRVDRTAR